MSARGAWPSARVRCGASSRGAALAAVLGAAALVSSCSSEREPSDAATAGSANGGQAGAGGAGGDAAGGAAAIDLCPSSECALPYADCNQDLDDGCEANIGSDPANCGACGYHCPQGGNHYSWPMCVNGVCQQDCLVFQSCGEVIAFGDCDGSFGNGCETMLESDASNCGTCGTTCPSGTPCVKGECGCAPTEVLCGNDCADLSSDPLHCGVCGKVCLDPDLGDDLVPRCQAGECTVGCMEQCGAFDCDNDPATACVQVASSAEHCGACNHPCPDGAPCQLGTCCNLDTLDTDPANCGDCGRSCAAVIWERIWNTDPRVDVPELSFLPKCDGGECFADCLAPWLDCNGDLNEMRTNGCETNGSQDPHNCGACGVSCAEGQVCLLGVCAMKPCDQVPR
jgi:hypothetical protein